MGTGFSFPLSRYVLAMAEIRYYLGQSHLGYNTEITSSDQLNNERNGRFPGFIENFENTLQVWSLSFYLLGAFPTIKGYLDGR